MKLLIVGGGGREHALAWALSRSPKLTGLYCAPGNAGTAQIATNLPLKPTNHSEIVSAVISHHIDLVVVGPEDPLAHGLVDLLDAKGYRAFGPTRAAAELEWSKAYAKTMLQRAGVPHADGAAFRDPPPAHAYLDHFATGESVVVRALPVIKANGLAAGRGVVLPASMAEAHAAIDDLLGGRFGAASQTIVIEERLSGLEASAMAFVDGDTVAPMPLSCDYKRACDHDQGPNTGGLGIYSPPGFVEEARTPALFASIHEPIVRALREAGRPYRGVLYAGLMLFGPTTAVLEFNCRFGDPETQAVLPRLQSDLLDVLLACVEGRLAQTPVEWARSATVGVVLASGGYPGDYAVGKPITGLDSVDESVLIFHAGTRIDESGRIVTAGGRVLTVVAQAPTLREAREQAYANADRIHFEGRHFRRDIALREL